MIYTAAPYAVPWGTARKAMYQFGYVPQHTQDGLKDGWPIANYESNFLTRRDVPTDVTIDVMVFGAGADYDVYATVCIEPTGTGKTMDVWMAQVADHYGPVNHDRNMVQDGSYGAEITLAPGECTTVVESFVLNAASLGTPDTVKFMVWTQDTNWVFEPEYFNNSGTWLSAYVAEIYQAAKALRPFEGVFVDNYEDGTTDAWSVVMP